MEVESDHHKIPFQCFAGRRAFPKGRFFPASSQYTFPVQPDLSARIDRKAAFLLKDGSIVDMDGSSNLEFIIEPIENLFVLVHHRNHLSIISAEPLISSKGLYSYEFHSVIDQAYGGSLAQKELGSNIYGMIGGGVEMQMELLT